MVEFITFILVAPVLWGLAYLLYVLAKMMMEEFQDD